MENWTGGYDSAPLHDNGALDISREHLEWRYITGDGKRY